VGSSRSPAELAGKLGRLGDELREVPKAATGAAALHVKKNVQALAPARLSGVGKRGVKIGVKYTIVGVGDSVKARVHAFGPFQLIERDTRAHVVPRAGKKRRKRLRVAVVPGYGPRTGIRHPGTKGKHQWAKGVAAARPQIRDTFRDEARSKMRGVF
jgi:hypothetical protein